MRFQRTATRIRRRITITFSRRLLRNHREHFQERIDRAMEAHGRFESWQASRPGDEFSRSKTRRNKTEGIGILRSLARNGHRRRLEAVARQKGHPLYEWAKEVLASRSRRR